MEERELNDIVNILDGMVAQDISRIKVATSDEAEEGSVSREYHHGRCDIGSPWARGCAFDVLEQPMEYNGEIIVDFLEILGPIALIFAGMAILIMLPVYFNG